VQAALRYQQYYQTMILRHKKTIAKEFLYLLSILLICLVAFIFCVSYNFYKQSQINELTNEKYALIHNHEIIKKRLGLHLNARIKLLTEYSHKFYPEYSDYELVQTVDEWWKIMQKYRNIDTVTYAWNHKWSKEKVLFNQQYGFQKPIDLSKFIEENSLTKADSISLANFNVSLSRVNLEKNASINSQFSNTEILCILFYTFLISFSMLFVGRYLIMGFVWSKKTLKD